MNTAPPIEIQSIAPTATVYRTRLKREGVPHQVAQIVANAIARWDSPQKIPANPRQQKLLREYEGQIRLAGLWKPGVMLAEGEETA